MPAMQTLSRHKWKFHHGGRGEHGETRMPGSWPGVARLGANAPRCILFVRAHWRSFSVPSAASVVRFGFLQYCSAIVRIHED
jgi:hypothetical protein